MRTKIITKEQPCGVILECKDWKQGTSIYCPIKDHGLIQYPNRGLNARIYDFCEKCDRRFRVGG